MFGFGDQTSQYVAALSAAIINIIPGFVVAWPSPTMPLLTSANSPIGTQLEVSQVAWVSSIAMLGTLLGNCYFGQLQDRFGRKGILLISAVPLVASWLMIGFTRSIEVLMVGRFLSGLAGVFPTMTTNTYISEISHPSIRGKLGMFNLCMVELGMVLVTSIGSYSTYLITSMVGVAVPVIFFFIFIWMPESPYYYLRKGDVDKAKTSLERLRSNSDVDKELLEMQSCVDREMKEKSNIVELFRVAKYRKGVIIGLGVKTLQQLSGTIAISTYNKVIFKQVSTGLDSSQSAVITTSVSIPAVLISSILVDKLGRKPLYYISTLGCMCALLCEFIYFFMQDYLETDVTSIGWLSVLGIFLFNIFRTFGIQTLPTIIITEIFPTNVKAVALNVILVYSSLLAFIVQLGFPLLVAGWGMYIGFGIFIVFCFAGFLFVMFVIPETKGKSLGDIQHQIESVVQHHDTRI